MVDPRSPEVRARELQMVGLGQAFGAGITGLIIVLLGIGVMIGVPVGFAIGWAVFA